MPNCVGCHELKPVAHFAKQDPLCRMCRVVLDENLGRPAREMMIRSPVRSWPAVAMPWRDQADLLTKTLKDVARRHGVVPRDVLGPSRIKVVALARIDLYRRLYSVLKSSSGVAQLVNRNHSTVHHYCIGKWKERGVFGPAPPLSKASRKYFKDRRLDALHQA